MNNNNIKISVIGDIMPSGVLYGIVDSSIDDEVVSVLRESDIRVGNLEAAIGPYTDKPHFDQGKLDRIMDLVWAVDEDLSVLKLLNIDAVSLANNHIYDLGIEGLLNTIKLLDNLNIKYFGAGANLEAASKPAVFNVKGKTVAFVGACDYKDETVGYVPFASENTAGVNPLYPLQRTCRIIKNLKNQYDFVFIVPHWGAEHTWIANQDVISDAKEIIKAGADGVLGGHPHRIQIPIYYKKKPLFPSLGNFLFPDWYINKPRPTWYPPKGTDTSKFPKKPLYPWVDEPTILVWRNSNRVGMIAEIDVSDTITMDSKYVYLDSDNRLHMLNDLSQQLSSKDIIHLKVSEHMYRHQWVYTLVRHLFNLKVGVKKLMSQS